MKRRNAFTLLELMIVIGIIAVLIGILIPVIGRVRESARVADTKNFVGQLSAAIETYQQDHRAYPGPLPNTEVWNRVVGNTQFPQPGLTINPLRVISVAVLSGTNWDVDPTNLPAQITMSENLVLGLLGGLRVDQPNTANQHLVYDPSIVGKGPTSLNPSQPKLFGTSISAEHLSWRDRDVGNVQLKSGKYMDGTQFEIADTIIPEFVDAFPESMPILYLRAKPGVQPIPFNTATNTVNSVITNDPDFANGTGRVGAYDLTQIIAYTASYDGMTTTPTMESQPVVSYNAAPAGTRTIGANKNPPKRYFRDGVEVPYAFPNHGLRTVDKDAKLSPPSTPAPNGYYVPFDAYPYFQNPGSPNSARNKDSYILIAAGADRMYGTADDIVSFGTVGE